MTHDNPDPLCRLLNCLFDHGRQPDEISKEFDCDEKTVIRLLWWTGKIRQFGYTDTRWKQALSLFNRRWNTTTH